MCLCTRSVPVAKTCTRGRTHKPEAISYSEFEHSTTASDPSRRHLITDGVLTTYLQAPGSETRGTSGRRWIWHYSHCGVDALKTGLPEQRLAAMT